MENTIEIIRRLNILKRATELDIFTMKQDIDITNSLERLSDLAIRYLEKVTPHLVRINIAVPAALNRF